MGTRRLLLAGVAVVVGASGIGGIAVAHGSRDQLQAELRGRDEVTDPPGGLQDRDARGEAEIRVRGTDQVCFRITFDNTGTPNRGHIHVGASGANGGIVVPLFELAALPADQRNDVLEKGWIADCVAADPGVVTAITTDPDSYYVNIHNSRFPAGSARGQLRD
jgi:hypothetical protein